MMLDNLPKQAEWDEVLNHAVCPACLTPVVWNAGTIRQESGSSPRVADYRVGDCCGITYSAMMIDQPASDHTKLFGIVDILNPQIP